MNTPKGLSQMGSGVRCARRGTAFSSRQQYSPFGRYYTSRITSALQNDAEGHVEPKIPLCQRPPSHTSALGTLLVWRAEAAELASSAGKSWEGDKDAPSVEDLQTELSWLLDDAVADISFKGDPAPERTWRDLERQIAVHPDGQGTVAVSNEEDYTLNLRESIEYLENAWIQRIKDRIPLQYLTSCAFWRDLILSVGPGVLVPRPETELMVDLVASEVAARPALGYGQWVDLGTGSGALAIGVAKVLPQATKIWAVDLAPEPVAHAAFNAARCGVGDRVTVVQGSWYEPLVEMGVEKLEGIVSNPPYIASQELASLQAEVGMHEPQLALAGGEGLGIDSLLPICLGAVKMLQHGGFMALETGGGEQSEYVAHLLRHLKEGEEEEEEEQLAFENVEIRRDLRGVGRFVTATRRAG